MARSNSFEGGSNGVTISAGNSGGASGDAVDSVSVGTGAVVAYSTAQAAHGSVSMTTSTGGTSSLGYVAYTLASGTSDICRAYCRFVSLPGAATQPILRYMNGLSQAMRVNVKTGGAIEIRDGANSVPTGGTTTSLISAGAWFRVELTAGIAAGTAVLRLYLTPDSSVASDTLTLSGVTFAATATELRFGIGSAMANAVQVWYDDLAVEGATWHGPAVRSITPSGIAVPVALGATALAQSMSVAPSGIAVPVSLGEAALAQSMSISPSGIAVPVALGATALAQDMGITPAGIAVPVGLGTPELAQPMAVTPSGIAVPVGVGTPSVASTEPAAAGALTMSPPRLAWRAHVPDTGWSAGPPGDGWQVGTPFDRWQAGPVQGGE